jgi:anaerobic magnesium-protoporphyrin IX monomethyl ester cyclase
MSVECVFTKYTGPLKCFDQFIPDLALAYLSSALKREGYSCELINLDLPGNSPQDLFEYLEKRKPDVLAVKLLRTGFPKLVEIVEEAKKVSPSTLVVGGGPHAQLCREAIFEFTDAFDALLTGESDRAIAEIVEVAHGERALHDVENVLFRNGNGNFVKKPITAISHLDDLPLPDWGLHDLERYLPIFPVSARRGCPYACAFCNYNYVASRENVRTRMADDGTVQVTRQIATRERTLPSLRQEIQHDMAEYGSRLFALVDATPDIQLTSDLCDWLINSSITTCWTSFARIKSFDGILEKMARAGWVSMWFGIESGSEKILKRMNKPYTVENIRRSTGIAHRAGINGIGAFIMGFPGEDETTLAETFKLAQELPVGGLVFSPYALAPGSVVAEIPEAYGVKPHEGWIKKYTYIPNEQSPFDVAYCDIDGEDNVARLQRFNPLVDNAYKKIRHRQVVEESDYAQLVATVMGASTPHAILLEVDAILNAGEPADLDAYLSRVWRAAENYKR